MNNLFLKFLAPFPFTESFQINDSTLEQLGHEASKFNVFPLYYLQLKRYQAETCESPAITHYLQKKKQMMLAIVANQLRQQHAQRELIRIFEKEDVPHIILKGSSLAQRIYNDINSRNSCDIDILIRDSDVEKVHEVMLRSGYIHNDTAPLPFLRSRLHHTTYTAGTPYNTPIEIHWNFSIPGFFNLSSSDIWRDVRHTTGFLYQLSPEMTIVSLLMHNHIHAFNQFRNYVDLLWAFHRFRGKLNWSHLWEEIHGIGLVKTSQISLQHIEQCWPEVCISCPHLKILLFRQKQRVTTRIISALRTPAAVHRKSAELTIIDKLLYRFALDRWRTILYSFTKTLFPSPKVICYLYPDAKGMSITRKYLKFFLRVLQDK